MAKLIDDYSLLEQLVAIQGVSSDEEQIKSFVISYIRENGHLWKTKPVIIDGPEFHDSFIVVFGKPRTAIYAHLDTIGFSVGYDKDLIKVGGPKLQDGTMLVGADSLGEVEAELVIHETEDGRYLPFYICERDIERGTLLSFKPNFRETNAYVQSPYMDNRLGVFNALKVAETMENGALVFTTYEEHGGNTVSFAANYLLENYGVHQALISDITWVTSGVVHDGGVAISLRDSLLPRRSFLNRILAIAGKTNIPYQLEVESAGGSDGSVIQKSHLNIDWCFIGAPEDHVHSPNEKVYKNDIEAMISLYQVLMKSL